MKYLKKIMAVALAAGMVFSGSVVDGGASSFKGYNSYDRASDDIDEWYAYDGTYTYDGKWTYRRQRM